MKLFLKHILRSIKKFPLQPIIIILTLTLATATFISATKICINVLHEEKVLKHTDNFISDITVKLSKSDDVRLLFDDDAKEIIGDEGKVLGEFVITALVNHNNKNNLIKVCASDIENADDFYGFRFLEYGNITNKNVNESVIISESTAKKYDLKLGDTLSLKLLNKRFDLRVEAIAKDDGALYSYAVLVNIGAISEALVEANPSIAAFADTITPSTELKIRLNDQSRCDEFIEKLSSDERFADKLVIKESENTGSADFFSFLSMIIVTVCSLIVLIISIIVIFTSLDLLSKKRMKDSALFMLCGANTKQLNGILYLECSVYAVAAAILGLLLSVPMSVGINGIFNWNTAPLTFKPYDILIAIFASPIIILFTALIHTHKAKNLSVCDRMSELSQTHKKNSAYVISLILLALTVLSYITALLVSPKYRYLPGILCTVFLITLSYVFIPCFVSAMSTLLIKFIEKRRTVPPKNLLALKNANISYPLKHSARLIAMMTTMLVTIFICLLTLSSESEKLSTIVDCEYVSLGANDKTDKIIENLDEVDATFRMSLLKNLVTEQGTGVLGISISEKALEFFNQDLMPKRIPRNNEIVITSGISILSEANVGDIVVLTNETNQYSFKVIEVIESSTNIVFIDAAYVKDKNELLCIQSDAKSDSEEFARIVNALEIRGAAIVETDTLLSPLTERILDYGELLSYIVLISFFTTLLGIINVLFSAYAVRKNERKVYYTAGMTRGQIRITVLAEILAIVIFALLLVPIFTFVLTAAIDVSINSFGVDLFYL